MSEIAGRPPSEFKPVEDANEARLLLREGAKALSSATIWTRDQCQVIQSHMVLYSTADAAIYFFRPKDLKIEELNDELVKSGTQFCFFSVSLPKANIFFKAKLLGNDTAGLKFALPEKVFIVQRRKDVRLLIPSDYTLKVEFDDPIIEGRKMIKKVIDISATGVSLMAAADEAEIFQSGVRLRNMSFSIRGRKISVTGEVRHSRAFRARTTNASGVKVGVQFADIRPGESQIIAAYVFEETRKYYTKFL